MEYRNLGKTGLKVSELCLGAMHFGGPADEQTSVRILDEFVEAGGTFIDTADVYNAGESESVVGRWLKGRDRDAMVIATKVYGAMGDGPNDGGLSRKHILAAVEASLRRLGTDYIDLYYTHVWDTATPIEETLSTLDTLVTSGKVRYLGASNVTGWQLQKSVDVAQRAGINGYSALQPLYNLLDREAEWELLAVCRNEGLGVMPWSPLRAGWLAGRFHRGMDAPPEGTRVAAAAGLGLLESWEYYDNERTWAVLDALHAIAGDVGHSVAQVALRWLIQTDPVTAPIIGPRTLEHYTDNIGAAGWSLSDDQLAQLTTVSEKPSVYPYDLLRGFNR
ncbi:aryl-alcohol dehydrogenase-like predicted oxidoreductase [Kribbella steppae]|uniref:Aryl-alcohol dehydrogenase-like predicted oxidoreductase n=1 Tax=Kribbella steppae TaxID=2512223 RepID=A0A4R2GTA0_9ACTN|nr:aldo/keto reductase [Kribbella steppae]TCO12838.1 aryl-alcohol dehydrogenase-like predicted oxidoreductase [Kribbella steppae]